MKNKQSTLLLILFLTIGNLSAQQYVWTQKANYGGGEVYDPFSFAIGTKGYAGSGYVEPRVYQQSFWEWDQATNVWTQKANFPGAGREGSRGFSIGNMGYVTCGYAPGMFLNDLWQYDTSANTWTQKTSFPGTARYLGVAFSLNNEGYFGLGSGTGNVCIPDLWQYDPGTDLWTQKANFIGTPRGAVSRFVINNEAYVGIGSNEPLGLNFKDFYKYDPIANSWTQIADFPGQPRNGAYGFAIDSVGFVLCGYNYVQGATIIYQDFYEYDPASNSWTQLPDFPGKAITEGMYFEMGIRGYIGVGCDTISFTHLQNEFWEYGPVSIPNASFQSSDSTICTNDCISFTNTSTNATSWLWSFPGAVPSSSTDENPQTVCYFVSGHYNVTLIASNGSSADTLSLTNYITVNPIPSTPNIIQSHDTLFCSTDPSYTSYQWYYYNALIPSATDTFLVYSFTGNYNVRVTNIYGCAIAVGINLITGLNEAEANSVFTLFPNPVNNELTISFPKDFHKAEIEIFDATGRNLIQKTFDSVKDNKSTIDFSNLEEGAYFVSINIDGKKWTKRVIKNLADK